MPNRSQFYVGGIRNLFSELVVVPSISITTACYFFFKTNQISRLCHRTPEVGSFGKLRFPNFSKYSFESLSLLVQFQLSPTEIDQDRPSAFDDSEGKTREVVKNFQ